MSEDQNHAQVKYSMKLNRWHFVFRLKLGLLALALCSLFVVLGTWQINRATEKKQLLLDLQQKSFANPVNLTTLTNPELLRDRFTPVVFDAVYLNKFTFLLDNQIYQHQPGYRVITVAQSPYLSKLILIDRGWIPIGSSREQLPDIKDVYGLKQIKGIINTIPSGIVLHKDVAKPEDNWPLIIQSLDYQFINAKLAFEVFPFVISLDSKDTAAFTMPAIDFGLPSDKHIAYAIEWYSFAILVILYYLFLSFKKKEP